MFEIKKIENLMGRKKQGEGYQDRIIDIDIIFYENLVLKAKSLVIPHPLAHKRDFVIFPAIEVIPEWIHPVLKKSLKALSKSLKIRKV